MNDVPGSIIHMKIMAKQATNRVSTVNLPDGQCTQTGKGTLEKLFIIHIPNSKLIEDSDAGQSQQNLGICELRGDWKVAKCVINQYKIRWALGTFRQTS
jgi:hypothetical protein